MERRGIARFHHQVHLRHDIYFGRPKDHPVHVGTADTSRTFPGDPVTFAVETCAPGCKGDCIIWSGGGTPATGIGTSFSTTWSSDGDYEVIARCGPNQKTFPVTVCPIAALLKQAAQFYGPSIDFTQVTVKAGMAGGGRPWTANNTIRFPKPTTPHGCPSLQHLVHELAHVWQYQNGNLQLVHGLIEQAANIVGIDPYNYGSSAGVQTAVSADTPLQSFSNESQAQIIEDCWASQNGGTAGYGNQPFTPQYTQGLQSLVANAGIGSLAPAGPNSIESAIGAIVNAVLGIFKK